jgi:hypothetical protein
MNVVLEAWHAAWERVWDPTAQNYVEAMMAAENVTRLADLERNPRTLSLLLQELYLP